MTLMNDPIPSSQLPKPALDEIPAVPVRPRSPLDYPTESFVRLLTSIATNSWKIRGRIMIDPKGEEPREELKKDDIKRLVRHLDSISEALTEFGVEIRDRTGEPYDFGLPEKIVSSMPRPGLTKELIVETLRPTIYWKSHIAQAGEVVIAVPEEKNTEQK